MTPLQKLTENVGNLGKIYLAKALKNCPKCNKSPNLVTLIPLNLAQWDCPLTWWWRFVAEELSSLSFCNCFVLKYAFRDVNYDWILVLGAKNMSIMPQHLFLDWSGLFFFIPVFSAVHIVTECYLKMTWLGCRHSSVDSNAPSIMPPRVQLSSTPSMLLSFIVKFLLYLSLRCEKNENKPKRGRVWPIFF